MLELETPSKKKKSPYRKPHHISKYTDVWMETNKPKFDWPALKEHFNGVVMWVKGKTNKVEWGVETGAPLLLMWETKPDICTHLTRCRGSTAGEERALSGFVEWNVLAEGSGAPLTVRAAALPPLLRHEQPRRLFTEGACQEDGGFLGGMKGCRVSNIYRKQTHIRGRIRLTESLPRFFRF